MSKKVGLNESRTKFPGSLFLDKSIFSSTRNGGENYSKPPPLCADFLFVSSKASSRFHGSTQFQDVCIYRGIPKFLMQFGVVPWCWHCEDDRGDRGAWGWSKQLVCLGVYLKETSSSRMLKTGSMSYMYLHGVYIYIYDFADVFLSFVLLTCLCQRFWC